VRNIEEKLVANADAEERSTADDSIAYGVINPVLRQPAHGRDERADAWKDEFAGARNHNGIRRDLQFCPRRAQRAGDVGDIRNG